MGWHACKLFMFSISVCAASANNSSCVSGWNSGSTRFFLSLKACCQQEKSGQLIKTLNALSTGRNNSSTS